MRQIVAYLAASVDGYIAGPDDDLGWLPQLEGDDLGFHDFFSHVGAVAMGRRTYAWIRDHSARWPYGDVPAYVLSGTMPEGRAGNITVTPGPLTDLAVKLREGEGTAWLVGGGRLFASFAVADLVDLWIITLVPVLLGAGIPLFPSGEDVYARLELVETRTLSGDCVQLHYRPRRSGYD
jgi:dihydrofolate reductase